MLYDINQSGDVRQARNHEPAVFTPGSMEKAWNHFPKQRTISSAEGISFEGGKICSINQAQKLGEDNGKSAIWWAGAAVTGLIVDFCVASAEWEWFETF